jgi:DNA primase
MQAEKIIKDSPIKGIGKEVAHIFTQYLLGNKEILDYLQNRGISEEFIKEERIGFCPPFLNYWFPLLRGRIIVSIADVHNEIIAFAGRQYEPSANAAINALRQIYDDNIVEAEKKVEMWQRGKWINEPYPKIRHLYNLDRAKNYIREMNYVIIVEGYFDALVLSLNGFPNTVALCSTKLSDRHATLLNRYCDKAILLLDGDVAGEKGSVSIEECLDKYEISHHTIYLPEGYDPDDFILQAGKNNLTRVINKVIEENKPSLKLNIKN